MILEPNYDAVLGFCKQLLRTAHVSGAMTISDGTGKWLSTCYPHDLPTASNAALSTIASSLYRVRMGHIQIAPSIRLEPGTLAFSSPDWPLEACEFIAAILKVRTENIFRLHHFGEMCVDLSKLQLRLEALAEERLEFVSCPPPDGGHRYYAPIRNGAGGIESLYELYVPAVERPGNEIHFDISAQLPGWVVEAVADEFGQDFHEIEGSEYTGAPTFSFFYQVGPTMRVGIMGRNKLGAKWLPTGIEGNWAY